MAKRTASNELNHLNWNEEDEPEEAGEFKRASVDVLQKRVIKTARRRNPISGSVSETPKSSVFGNFSGFGAKPAPAPSTAFSFLNNLNKDKESVNGSNMLTTKVTNSPLFKIDNKKEEKKDEKENGEYLAKIKALNESVSNWIKSKVDQNPYVDLKPVFKDYEKHFEELKNNKEELKNNKDELKGNKEELKGNKELKSNKEFKSNEESKPDYSMFSFKPPEQKDTNENKKATKATFLFGVPNQSTNENLKNPSEIGKSLFKTDNKEDKPTFTFGAPNKDSESNKFTFGIPTSTPMFSFGSNASPSFNLPSNPTSMFPSTSNTKPTNTEEEKDKEKNDEDDDEPPKNDFTPVVEEGHIYTTKCKIFVKSDGKFGDRGVGTLYLKPVPDSEKVQMIVRADTSLGKVLCNFILSKSIPTKRMGKKDVMLVTVPTPDTKPPPVPILVRVKSPEEADQLLAELEKHKK